MPEDLKFTCSWPITFSVLAIRLKKTRYRGASLLIRLHLQLQSEPVSSTINPDPSHEVPHNKQIIMPRQGRSGGGRAPSRPTVAPQRPAAPPKQQTRPATTAAHPPQQAAPPAQAQQGSAGPGLFGQMASTAMQVHPRALNLGHIANTMPGVLL